MLQQSQVLQERYQLQEKLGQNAGRQTWLAVDVQAQPRELVIVKLLAFSPQMQWEDFKLFEREAQVLKQLNYPRIPRYRDYFSLDKQAGSGLYWFGLVQEYIPGTSLQKMLERGDRFSESQVRSLATQVLKILTYLHELNPIVLHRDIKPSNIIWGENDRVYLVDFGAVQEQAAVEGVTFTVVGTAGYAPLEQFWGRAVPASDLYSLGATLIHLLTGISPVDLPQQNLRIQFKDRVSLNPNLIGWIEALTAPDLTQRYSTAKDAIADLNADRYLNAPLQQIRQPTGSCVKLWKSPSQLKLEIPGRGIKILWDIFIFGLKVILAGTSLISIVVFLLLLVGLFFGGAILMVSMIENPFGTALLLSILLSLVWLVTRSISSLSTDSNHLAENLKIPLAKVPYFSLYLDKSYLILEYKLLGWKYFKQRCYTATIKQIEQIPGKEISIDAGELKYAIGQTLTEYERYWVTQELQSWLLEK